MKKTISTLLIVLFSFATLAGGGTNQDLLKKVDHKLYSFLNLDKSLSKVSVISKPGIVEVENGFIGVIVKTRNVNLLKTQGFNVNSTFGDYATVRIKTGELVKLAESDAVDFISAGQLNSITNDVGGAVVGARLLNEGYVNSTKYKGNGVLVCIIDTGIDWKHLDFRDPSDTTKSRIVYVWDQTISKTGAEKTPQDRDPGNLSGLDYGVEYSSIDINNEIDGSPAGLVREQDTNGHGTHVAGTAAGNGNTLPDKKYAGMAPEADLLIIKAGNGSFSSVHIIDALSYAAKIATQLGKPIVVNMSLGGNYGPHDGTGTQDQAVDNFVTSASGRVCVISAGNSGSDLIHITGSVGASATAVFNFTVPSYSATSGSGNDVFGFDLWFNSSGSVNATVLTPHAYNVNTSGATNDGYIELANQVNGVNNNREVDCYVYDYDATKPPASGTWKLSVTNTSASSMIYHGWLYSNSMGTTLNGADANYTVGSPGTANDALTVGSFVTRWRWHSSNGSSYLYSGTTDRTDDISSFSSIGPRRDGVQKPDVAAPGQAIISARSASTNPDATILVANGQYLVEQGTSMASPITAGCVALLLQQNHNLSYLQAKSYITGNASTDAFTGAIPNYNWGYGKLNVFNAMVASINTNWPRNFKVFIYDGSNPNPLTGDPYTYVNPNTKFAIKFTPNFNGEIIGTLLHIYLSNGITSPLYFEVWSDNGGKPGTKLGNTVNYDASNLVPYTWNYINLIGSKASLSNGTDYYLVAYFTSGTQTGILIDNTNIDSKTFRDYNDGQGWVVRTYDMRMRPVVAPERSLVPVASAGNIPFQYQLYNNYPNPFNPSTIIKYELAKPGFVKLVIYDVLGRVVRILVNGEQTAGSYSIPFKGESLSSGVYFYRIESGDFVQSKKMILLK